MQTIPKVNNLDLIKQLDKEGISLDEYFLMLVEKELSKMGLIKLKNAHTILKELKND